MSAALIPSLKTAGFQIPCLGFGTYKISIEEIPSSLRAALDIGCRHIDCAHLYLNEEAIGEALSKWMQEHTSVKREDLFITSKLWNTCHRPEMVKPSCLKSMKALQLSYLDLFLVHWPVSYQTSDAIVPTDSNGNTLFDEVDLEHTWRAMEALVREGLVRHIGLSNFNESQIQRIIDCAEIKPAILQIECNCHFPNRDLVNFATSNDIIVTAYAPLGCPYRDVPDREYRLIDEPILLEIAKKHSKTAAQIAIRHTIQHGIGVIPKSKTPERIRENFKVFDFELSEEDVQKIDKIGIHRRQIVGEPMRGHKEFPFLDLL